MFVSKNGNDAAKFQEDKTKFKAFIDQYIRIFKEAESNPEYDLITLVYGGNVITQSEILLTLFDDLRFAILSFIMVYFFTLRHMKSVFLTTMGLLQIIATFPISLLLFDFVNRGINSSSTGAIKLGVLHALSIYIMLGIGVDDLYVLLDAFRQQNDTYTVENRMKIAWKRASSAMLITSFTTAAAFATNIVTIIPVIQGFVIFMSILVVFNYILVITVFPLTIMFYKVHAERVEKHIYASFNGMVLKKNSRCM